jgi:glycosyltransferase involved in cell wall biosynthesis
MTEGLPTEQEIMAQWRGDPDAPLVSICCITYNHAPYIRDALEGFLRQRTDFPFEIIVHDDASTDETVAIIREYIARYPRLFVPIFQSENQFSRGRKPSALIFGQARGAFMALCEGDDYWTDPEKLSRQVAVLRDRPDIDLCSHGVDSDGTVSPQIRTSLSEDPLQDYGIYEVISKSHALTSTASVMVRRQPALRFAEYVSTRPALPFGDVYLKFFGALRGGAVFINRRMAFYRRQSVGSWSARRRADFEMLLRDSEALMRSYAELDRLSEQRRTSMFDAEIRHRLHHIAKARRVPFRRRWGFLWRNRDLVPISAVLRFYGTLLLAARPGGGR